MTLRSKLHPARANVLGVGVHAIDMESAVAVINCAIDGGRKGYVCVTGVHGVMEARRDPQLAAILQRALLVTPDGMPTVWVGRMQGFTAMRRVFGPELMLEICARSRGASHFLCGGAPGVADELARVLAAQFPGIRIVGTYTPPFRSMTSQEREAFCQTVNALRPDIIWVGLGTPKQELFMGDLLPHLDTRVMIGVGAAFDYHTGRINDSPAWVKRAGLQWLHRLMQEPSRLWRRYLLNNPRFLFHIALQLAGMKKYGLREDSSRSAQVAA
jgi:N-acetylglucosaminyldiphosphoundecaprenol N-acetyl-beta-D-mannosaminyltransferase